MKKSPGIATTLTILILLVITTSMASLYWLVRFRTTDLITQQVDDHSKILLSSLDWAISPLLRRDDQDSIQRLIESIGAFRAVKVIRLYDRESRVLASNSPQEVGKIIPTPLLHQVITQASLFGRDKAEGSRDISFALPVRGEVFDRQIHSDVSAVLYLTNDILYYQRLYHPILDAIVQTGLGLALLLVIFSFLYMNKTIIKSLNKLVRAIGEVQSGNYKPDLAITSPPEINLFAAMFSRMLEEIDQKNHALEDYSTTLEEKVEEKTRHLQETLEDLKRAQANLIRQEKLASLGQLAAGVAHEINNPAGFIASNLQTMSEYMEVIREVIAMHEELAESALQHNRKKTDTLHRKLLVYRDGNDFDYIMKDTPSLLSESSEGADRIKRIVHGLKAYARAESEEFLETDINEVIKDAIKLTANELKYTCLVNMNLSPIPRILCQPDKLTQVFVNLLINASQAVEEKGVIEIKSCHANRDVFIEIIDDGKGIPEEHLNRLFDPFFTTKKVGKGTGLGLSISQGIVRNHSGKIDVSSRPGKGTKFTITLPLKPRKNDDDQ